MTEKTESSTLTVEGYASLFDEVDSCGDIVVSGAFTKSLSRLDGKKIPLLFNHDTSEPVGVWDDVAEDEKGLFVRGRILSDGRGAAQQTIRLIKNGNLTGLSIGYITKKANSSQGGSRKLNELDLWEVSVVGFPMLRGARLKIVEDK